MHTQCYVPPPRLHPPLQGHTDGHTRPLAPQLTGTSRPVNRSLKSSERLPPFTTTTLVMMVVLTIYVWCQHPSNFEAVAQVLQSGIWPLHIQQQGLILHLLS
jgi:hypothetical protein